MWAPPPLPCNCTHALNACPACWVPGVEGCPLAFQKSIFPNAFSFFTSSAPVGAWTVHFLAHFVTNKWLWGKLWDDPLLSIPQRWRSSSASHRWEMTPRTPWDPFLARAYPSCSSWLCAKGHFSFRAIPGLLCFLLFFHTRNCCELSKRRS